MPQNTRVESFLEMLAVEHGVNETTRHKYRRTLQALTSFLASRGRGIEDAQAEDIRAYLTSLGKKLRGEDAALPEEHDS